MSAPHMHFLTTLAAVLLLGACFAKLEIAIEGDAGSAANLPTWRIEHHCLLDLLCGGRAMTGYHAWALPPVALFFHFPLAFSGDYSLLAELRALGCIMVFWVCEDFLWFVFNPAFGVRRFRPTHAGWHKHWIGGAPVEYWLFGPLGLGLLWLSCR